MARLIRHEANSPYIIPPTDQEIHVCACGLSQKLPYCDGSHRGTTKELVGKVYVYDKTRKHIIREIADA